MDAGTDNGFTFTSPNWPTSPQGSIFRITNVYPSHPAGSFNYPEKPIHMKAKPNPVMHAKPVFYRADGSGRDTYIE